MGISYTKKYNEKAYETKTARGLRCLYVKEL